MTSRAAASAMHRAAHVLRRRWYPPHLVLHGVCCVRLEPAPVVGGLMALRVLRHVEPKHNVPPAGRGRGGRN